MEGLIIMAVIALLTRLFSSNDEKQKKQKPTQAMPPFSNDKPLSKTVIPQQPKERRKPVVEVKSLEDFAQEVFGQLQQKSEQPKPVTPTPVVPVPEPVQAVETYTRPKLENRVETTRNGLQERPQLGADRAIIQQVKKKQASAVVIPTTRQELVQSIVMAEVLGAPKSKRPNRI